MTMIDQLTVVKDLANVGQALASMASSASANRKLRKRDMIIVDNALLLLKATCRASGVSQLTRQSINELAQTLQLIQASGYSGEMLEMSKSLWRIQYAALSNIVSGYQLS